MFLLGENVQEGNVRLRCHRTFAQAGLPPGAPDLLVQNVHQAGGNVNIFVLQVKFEFVFKYLMTSFCLFKTTFVFELVLAATNIKSHHLRNQSRNGCCERFSKGP